MSSADGCGRRRKRRHKKPTRARPRAVRCKSFIGFRGKYHPWIGMGEGAKIMTASTGHEWTSEMFLDWLRSRGAVMHQIKPGKKKGRYYTSETLLRKAFPDLWDELLRAEAAEDNGYGW